MFIWLIHRVKYHTRFNGISYLFRLSCCWLLLATCPPQLVKIYHTRTGFPLYQCIETETLCFVGRTARLPFHSDVGVVNGTGPLQQNSTEAKIAGCPSIQDAKVTYGNAYTLPAFAGVCSCAVRLQSTPTHRRTDAPTHPRTHARTFDRRYPTKM